MSARPSTFAVVLTLALAGLAGCGKTGALQRPGPLFGPTKAAPSADQAKDKNVQDPSRPIRTIDPRHMMDDATDPSPNRDLPIGGQNPTATDNPPPTAMPRVR